MLRAVLVASILAVVVPSTAHAGRPLCKAGAKHRGATLDLDVKDADVQDVLRMLADVGNVNIVIAEEVRGKVTLRLKRASWDAAACTIASMHKLRIDLDGNILLVTKS